MAPKERLAVCAEDKEGKQAKVVGVKEDSEAVAEVPEGIAEELL